MAERMLTAYDVTPTANERIQAQMNAMKMMEMQRQIAEQQDTRAAFNQFYNQGIEQQTPVPQNMEQQAGRLVDDEMGNPVAPVPMQTTRRRPNLQEVGNFFLDRGDMAGAANVMGMQRVQEGMAQTKQKAILDRLNSFSNALQKVYKSDPSGKLLKEIWPDMQTQYPEFARMNPDNLEFREDGDVMEHVDELGNVIRGIYGNGRWNYKTFPAKKKGGGGGSPDDKNDNPRQYRIFKQGIDTLRARRAKAAEGAQYNPAMQSYVDQLDDQIAEREAQITALFPKTIATMGGAGTTKLQGRNPVNVANDLSRQMINTARGAASGAPAGAVRVGKTKDGRDAYKLPDGSYWAQ